MCMPLCTRVEARVGSQGAPFIILYHCLGQGISPSWKITVLAGLVACEFSETHLPLTSHPHPRAYVQGSVFMCGLWIQTRVLVLAG